MKSKKHYFCTFENFPSKLCFPLPFTPIKSSSPTRQKASLVWDLCDDVAWTAWHASFKHFSTERMKNFSRHQKRCFWNWLSKVCTANCAREIFRRWWSGKGEQGRVCMISKTKEKCANEAWIRDEMQSDVKIRKRNCSQSQNVFWDAQHAMGKQDDLICTRKRAIFCEMKHKSCFFFSVRNGCKFLRAKFCEIEEKSKKIFKEKRWITVFSFFGFLFRAFEFQGSLRRGSGHLMGNWKKLLKTFLLVRSI